MHPEQDDITQRIKKKLARMDLINCLVLVLSIDKRNYIRFNKYLYDRIDEFEGYLIQLRIFTTWDPKICDAMPGLKEYLERARIFPPFSRKLIEAAEISYITGEI